MEERFSTGDCCCCCCCLFVPVDVLDDTEVVTLVPLTTLPANETDEALDEVVDRLVPPPPALDQLTLAPGGLGGRADGLGASMASQWSGCCGCDCPPYISTWCRWMGGRGLYPLPLDAEAVAGWNVRICGCCIKGSSSRIQKLFQLKTVVNGFYYQTKSERKQSRVDIDFTKG